MNKGQEGFFGGTYLRVNLSTGRFSPDQLEISDHRSCLGGTCFGAKVLYDEVPPGIEWSTPNNRLVVASGPLGGTQINGSGTVSVVTKGPLTNGAAASQANGFLGVYMRLNGFDGVIIQGKSPSLTYLYLHDGEAELRDAEHLAGVDTWQMTDLIAQELDVREKDISVFGIGPAGENLVRFAALVGDRGHVAGHNGIGAVVGSKRLKAIVVRRVRRRVPVYDRNSLTNVARSLSDATQDSPASWLASKWGTLRGVALGVRGDGWLPVKNYTTNIYSISTDQLATWDGPYFHDHYAPQRHSCWACGFRHCHIMTVPDGPSRGFVGEEPEFEQFAAFGPVIGNTDASAAFVLANECDRLGFENNEIGWLIGWVMECYEKGLLTRDQLDGLDMRWGNVEAVGVLMHRIARREGVGDLLAEGVMRACQEVGGEAVNLAIHTSKGNTPRGHDHRARWTEMFDTATSSTGTMEVGPTHTMPIDALRAIGVESLPDQSSPEDVAAFNGKTNGAMLFEDSLGVCRFTTRTHIPLLVQAVNAATGWDLTVGEAMEIGRRGVNLLRAFNIRHGINREQDRCSSRYWSTPKDGPVAGKTIRPHWNRMLSIFYRLMGWDERGVPKRETLEALGIGSAADDLGV